MKNVISHSAPSLCHSCTISEMCMDYNPKKCLQICHSKGYVAQLLITYTVCLSKYLCNCSCPEFSDDSCERKCAQEGRLVKFGLTMGNCKKCHCVCPQYKCTVECAGHEFEVINDTSGCPYCNCKCPFVDCDSHCNGTGLGIPGPRDAAGCYSVCAGCITPQETGMVYIYILRNVNEILFVLVLCAEMHLN